MVTPSPQRYITVEQVFGDWLKATLGYPNLTHELPTNLTFLMPLVVVERFGGSDATVPFDTAHVDVDVYAPTRADALAHGEHIRQAIRTKLHGHTMTVTTTTGSVGVTFGRPQTISAPKIVTFDSKSQIRRSTASYQLLLHQFTGVA
jgi:GGDEF domain-containing protein